MADYVSTAINLGLEEICFTDHVPLPGGFDPTHRMQPEELPGYRREVSRLQAEFNSDIKIRLGLECDYMPGLEPWLEQLLYETPYDFILGSIHFLGRYGDPDPCFVMRPGSIPLQELEAVYWVQMEQLVLSGLYDAVAHLDIFKRSGWQPDSGQQAQIERIFDLMTQHEIALEFNSSGWDKPGVREAYPDRSLLQLARELNLALTFGSDAHAPSQVGRHRDRITAAMLECGFTRYAVYRERQPVYLSLG